MRCTAEKKLCDSEGDSKHQCRQQFIAEQRTFDKEVRRAKRLYWYTQQQTLMAMKQSRDFWKMIGQIGIHNKPKKQIPWEVVETDGTISTNRSIVLNKWKNDFEQLLSPKNIPLYTIPDQASGPHRIMHDTTSLNAIITIDEIRFAVAGAAKGKAVGDDGIPLEVLHNDTCINYLVTLFNVCFDSATIPEQWSKGIINPIVKDPKSDPRHPLNYRGITITSSVYKVFCSVLNCRLSNLIETNPGIGDEQNGFRKG